MKVPFEKLGPGQSGRLVYQVMGVNGPIFNPDRIRYLAPDKISEFKKVSPSLPSAFSALAVANLAASVGGVALSATILRQINKLHAKVDRVLFTLDQVEAKVDHLIQTVQRIDTKVSENNLRHALEHILNKAVGDDEIDLRVLGRVQNDLKTFSESLENGFMPCNSFGLRLSSDVEDKLESIYKLLFGVRYFIYSQHNMVAQGDPLRSLTINRLDDYLPKNVADPVLAVGMRKALDCLNQTQQQLGQKVFDEFFFAGEEAKTKYSEWFENAVTTPVAEAFAEGDTAAFCLAADWRADISEGDQAAEFYDGLRSHWLWHTSSGLLWRTYVELNGLTKGYNEAWSLGREEIEPFKEARLMMSAPVDDNELDQIISSYTRKPVH